MSAPLAPPKTVLLVQLPLPRLNYGRQTGNVPLGGACLKQAAKGLADIDLAPESVVSYLGDAALIDHIVDRRPAAVGFTVFNWNVHRCLYFAAQLKHAYGPLIFFGGPEVTADNDLVKRPVVDVCIYGEGEAAFCQLVQGHPCGSGTGPPAGDLFTARPSPYLHGWLEPQIENIVLLETQRGCPHRCGYCYYNKSRKGLAVADRALVREAVRWAWDQGVKEIYLLDPCLNTRPDLNDLLADIAAINHDRRLSLISEIRAESIGADLADRFAAAGFTWFEIGLQTTTAAALRLMRRPTDLKAFLNGTALLRQRGIATGIDLIVGLPGDTLTGFDRTLDFVAGNRLGDDVQVFPLSILPGTDFRRKRAALGLIHEPAPPYHILSTPAFSQEEILLAVDHAETRFDVALYVMPDLDLAYKKPAGSDPDHWVRRGKGVYLARLVMDRPRPASQIQALARRLTQPYQVMVWPGAGDIQKIIGTVTQANPFTPLEIVFFNPPSLPDTAGLLAAAHLHRPHYLDGAQRLLYPQPGNRAILFTVVSECAMLRVAGPMQRQVLWWRRNGLPTARDLDRTDAIDGILIDTGHDQGKLAHWQDRHAARAGDLVAIGFADPLLQQRWLQLTMNDEYDFTAFDWV